MSNVRQLVDLEHWPVGLRDGGWKGLVSISPRVRKSPWTEARRRALEETVECEVVPRLLLGRLASDRLSRSSRDLEKDLEGDNTQPTERELSELVRLVSDESLRSSLAHVERIRARGMPLEAIFLNLLAPAAHLLGEMWADDTADFATVTIATSRLHQILRELAPELRSPKGASRRGARALLVALPGDQHTFGVTMLQEFLRHGGWTVSGDIPDCYQDLVDIVGTSPFRVIGISVSCDTVPDGLSSLIRDVRSAALDPRCRIVVGGRLFLTEPDLVRIVGADGTATDAQAATRELSSLLDTKAV